MHTADQEAQKILVFCDYYLPGYKAGGPIASVSRIVALDTSRHYRVISRDRDLGDDESYPDSRARMWMRIGNSEVQYLRRNLRDAIWSLREVWLWRPDWYYCNSVFSPWATLLPLFAMRLRFLPRAMIMLAPRGELSVGALGIRPKKKRALAFLVKWLIGPRVAWHVSSPAERDELMTWWGKELPKGHRVIVAMNSPCPPAAEVSQGPKCGFVVLFASRIDRKKGLDRAIEIIRLLSSLADVKFYIAGAISDHAYWAECRQSIESLPKNVEVRIIGSYSPDQAADLFGDASVFLFPTKGENFGHAIAEALSVGCPVFAPAGTPWTEILTESVGQVLGDDAVGVSLLFEMSKLDPIESAKQRMHTLSLYRKWHLETFGKCNPFDATLDVD